MDCAIAGFAYECSTPDGPAQEFDLDQALAALKKGKNATPPEKHLYACFDWFLYYTDRLAYLVDSVHLTKFEDVAAPFKPYAALLLADGRWPLIEPLVTAHNYRYVKKFFERVRATE